MKEYLSVTEIPGHNATGEQLARLYQRYNFAAGYCKNKDVLEVACGAGMGLGYLSKSAKNVIGGDIDEKLLDIARTTYIGRNNIEIKAMDAQQMPLADNSCDIVILYEAIYYIADVEKFFKEAYRVLRNKGVVIVCTVNKNWADFNPSPYSVKYYSVPELYGLISRNCVDVSFFGGFETEEETTKDRMISIIKRIAVKLHLMPKTMGGKELLKKIFWGKLKPIPVEVEAGLAECNPPEPIPHDKENTNYKVLFATGYVRKGEND